MLGHEEQILDEPLVPLKLIDLRLYGRRDGIFGVEDFIIHSDLI
tara:strand:- start:465 stop:596 length:132 start_codon:yes stop_codon:yes gene_type:complete